VGPGGTDSVKQLRVLPVTAWMADGCGIAAGKDTTATGNRRFLSTLTVAGKGSYFWENPDSAQIQALWAAPDCLHGWAVGKRGFIGRLRPRSLAVSRVSAEGALETLRGRYRLEVDSSVEAPAIERLHLEHAGTSIALAPGKDFGVESVNGSPTTAFRIHDSGRAAAAVLAGKPVRIRFDLRYPLVNGGYPVSYRTDEITLFKSEPWYKQYWPVLAVLAAVAVWGLVDPRVTRSDAGSPVLQRFHFGWIYDVLELGLILSLKTEWMKRRFFRMYRHEFQRLYLPAGAGPSELKVVSCPVLESAGGGRIIEGSLAFDTIIRRRDRLLWLKATPGDRRDALLAQWAALSWERGHVPVMLSLEDQSPIDDQVWRALHELGAINRRHQKLWQMGGFVFLLHDPDDAHDEAALQAFLASERSRNFVILWRNEMPNIGACQLAPAFMP
jgi:hypothetical protein